MAAVKLIVVEPCNHVDWDLPLGMDCPECAWEQSCRLSAKHAEDNKKRKQRGEPAIPGTAGVNSEEGWQAWERTVQLCAEALHKAKVDMITLAPDCGSLQVQGTSPYFLEELLIEEAYRHGLYRVLKQTKEVLRRGRG